MKEKRKRYTEEFKSDAVRLVVIEGLSVPQVARDLGVCSGSLYDWVKRSKDMMSTEENDLAAENARLRKENRILKEEREILKKATAFFVKETK